MTVSGILRYGFAGSAIILAGLQFVPSELPPSSSRPASDLLGSGVIPDDVASMLKTSCYDCHSVETRYPWYSHVAPVSWLVAKDVREGREELNFSDWSTLSRRKKVSRLEDIKEMVAEGDMPMPIYLALHWDARLTDAQRQRLADWSNALQDQVISEPEPEEEEEEEEDEEDEDEEES